jgi:hypothetical protein
MKRVERKRKTGREGEKEREGHSDRGEKGTDRKRGWKKEGTGGKER